MLYHFIHPLYIFGLFFICLLFFRRSSSYDFDAYLAIAFGTFIGGVTPTIPHPIIQMFMDNLYSFNMWFYIVQIIYLILSIKQLYPISSKYGDSISYLIENPIPLFIFTIFLTLSLPIPPAKITNYSVFLIQYTVLWVTLGSIVTTLKKIIPDTILRYLFGGIGSLLGLMLVIMSIGILLGVSLFL